VRGRRRPGSARLIPLQIGQRIGDVDPERTVWDRVAGPVDVDHVRARLGRVIVAVDRTVLVGLAIHLHLERTCTPTQPNTPAPSPFGLISPPGIAMPPADVCFTDDTFVFQMSPLLSFSTGCAVHATIHDRRPRLYCRRAARMEQSA